MTYQETKELADKVRAKTAAGEEPEAEAIELILGVALNLARLADAVARMDLIREQERLDGRV